MAFFECGTNNGTTGMPLLISSSGESTPTVTVAVKGTKYRITAGGDSHYVVMNGYKGTFTLENTKYSSKLPTMIKTDGTVESTSYTTYSTKDVAALKVFVQVNHVVDYYITFN